MIYIGYLIYMIYLLETAFHEAYLMSADYTFI